MKAHVATLMQRLVASGKHCARILATGGDAYVLSTLVEGGDPGVVSVLAIRPHPVPPHSLRYALHPLHPLLRLWRPLACLCSW